MNLSSEQTSEEGSVVTPTLQMIRVILQEWLGACLHLQRVSGEGGLHSRAAWPQRS